MSKKHETKSQQFFNYTIINSSTEEYSIPSWETLLFVSFVLGGASESAAAAAAAAALA